MVVPKGLGLPVLLVGDPDVEVFDGMLGIIAMNFPGRRLTWDSPNMRFSDCDEANRYVDPPYREGWSL